MRWCKNHKNWKCIFLPNIAVFTYCDEIIIISAIFTAFFNTCSSKKNKCCIAEHFLARKTQNVFSRHKTFTPSTLLLNQHYQKGIIILIRMPGHMTSAIPYIRLILASRFLTSTQPFKNAGRAVLPQKRLCVSINLVFLVLLCLFGNNLLPIYGKCDLFKIRVVRKAIEHRVSLNCRCKNVTI